VGSPSTVAAGLDALVRDTGADELMIVTSVFDFEARLRSYELLAGVVGNADRCTSRPRAYSPAPARPLAV
jgi:alkanesulfonate monooxygenase SsuD/methylene tetrahydromethanopterin reductase-like flavin-dependent oxidoreductase (luciferase family)